MTKVMYLTMVSQLLTMVLGVGMIGVVFGVVAAIVVKRRQDNAASPKQTPKKPDAETQRRLRQLKEQLDSGLLTKEEYREKREALLKE